MTFRSLCASVFGAVLALTVSLTSGAAAQAAPAPPNFVPSEVLVGVHESADTADTRGRIERIAGAILRKQAKTRVYRIKVKKGVSVEQAIAELEATSGITYAEPNYTVKAFGTVPSDTYYGSQYAPQKVQADLAWELWQPKAQTVIAIIDTGVQINHPDLAGKVVGGYDFVNSDTDPSDDNGHGTHCAGIAAAQTNNGTGVAGIAGWNGTSGTDTSSTKIMPVKVLAADGYGTDAGVADGIIYAADNGATVISLSLGGDENSITLQNAVDYAYSKGCVIVAAAGNHASTALNYPAAYSNVISVASTDSTDTLSDFSAYGSWVKVAAPGYRILSTLSGSTYAYTSGTSMAAPLVAGEAALIRSHSPNLTNAQVGEVIVGNTDGVNSYAGRTIGGGRVNVLRALQAAALLGNVPVGTSAAFVKADTATQGNWKNVYGSEGYQIANGGAQVPSFAQVSDTVNGHSWTWAAPTGDVRALSQVNATGRIASCWYTDYTRLAYDININLTDGNAHQVALYCLDFDRQGRSQRIDVYNADTGALLDSRTVSGFGEGTYLVWNVQGNVRFRVTHLDGGQNAVVSAIFFGDASAPAPPPPASASTAFVRTDATTQGTWKGVYGAAGYRIANGETLTPSFTQVSDTINGNSWTWAAPTSDVRALSQVNTAGRIASCWYNDYSRYAYDIDINLTDGNTHQVALYMLDFDRQGRQQRIDVFDAVSGALLDSRTVADFQNGVYLVWNVKGSVRFKVTHLNAGVNAVVSGLFID